jgi:putative heme-binding domain-containing protein
MIPTSPFRFVRLRCLVLLASWCFLTCDFAVGAEIAIPRKQTKPPNKPYTPAEAIAKMTVPEGFTVELCAAEPDVVNPVAMTFDERGRVWITESLEYPRRAPGPGRDRVKILADADGDGTFETAKIFAEGLNIPSGIAVGHGGVWVANAPDILFYPDANRDDVADGPPQVVVTGFGRDDTHELPNSLTWGPDGYLYGLNGVFNRSVIKQNGKTFDFTCAMFRIDPRTSEFSLFCEGTSNPWGIAFNDNGDAFISACVIDHLWHLVETGYYHRQGGPYPPFTWKLGSIVDYKHQMAAYCGITWFDSDAYPEPYRNKLYMGNIHGGCINVDRVERNGATYKGYPEPDFLTANDAWFMPVVQKVGPDGCLYILDWYDRYHCYQDANADPEGVDRLKGRLYRVRYQGTPRAPKFDLTKETDDQLIERLQSPNIFYREIAQRLLAERNDPATRKKLEQVVVGGSASRSSRRHALWALIGTGSLDESFHRTLFAGSGESDSAVRSWSVRAAGIFRSSSEPLRLSVQAAAASADPDVRLQATIATAKLLSDDATAVLLRTLDQPNEMPMQREIVWQNLLPRLERTSSTAVEYFKQPKLTSLRMLQFFVPWEIARGDTGVVELSQLLTVWLDANDFAAQSACSIALSFVTQAIDTKQLPESANATLRRNVESQLLRIVRRPEADPLRVPALSILCSWKNEDAVALARDTALDLEKTTEERSRAGFDWIRSRDPRLVQSIPALLGPTGRLTLRSRREYFDVLTRFDDPQVGAQVLSIYGEIENELKPAAVELLTSRVAWSNALLDAIAAGRVPKDAVNLTQIAKLLKNRDKALSARVEQTWGKLRTDRNPQREQVVADMRKLLAGSHGDAVHGQVVFMKLCGQCHKLHGTGQDVGPDITVNGRSSFEQLLNNVFDPSLVIGNAYQARTVVTTDGRVLSGLLVEDNPQRVVLKLQGGKLETIARADVEEMEISKLSLMPEGVEKQLQPQELIDLFALLKLDKPPTDLQAKPLPNFTELK